MSKANSNKRRRIPVTVTMVAMRATGSLRGLRPMAPLGLSAVGAGELDVRGRPEGAVVRVGSDDGDSVGSDVTEEGLDDSEDIEDVFELVGIELVLEVGFPITVNQLENLSHQTAYKLTNL
jgi:hypothetical protein